MRRAAASRPNARGTSARSHARFVPAPPSCPSTACAGSTAGATPATRWRLPCGQPAPRATSGRRCSPPGSRAARRCPRLTSSPPTAPGSAARPARSPARRPSRSGFSRRGRRASPPRCESSGSAVGSATGSGSASGQSSRARTSPRRRTHPRPRRWRWSLEKRRPPARSDRCSARLPLWLAARRRALRLSCCPPALAPPALAPRALAPPALAPPALAPPALAPWALAPRALAPPPPAEGGAPWRADRRRRRSAQRLGRS
mmetsp:Transcript_1453/g.4690  ORF Transcript_1453/g.4690 Transcript_1453/m.4690 type:complete len:259 (+) Transcript_1453:261-1037(+)